MTRAADLKKGDRVIYYGYVFPERRGDSGKISGVSNAEDVAVIFDSDKLCTSCNAKYLKKVVADNGA